MSIPTISEATIRRYSTPQGAVQQALQIASAGLALSGKCGYDLATWTSELAEGLGDRICSTSG